MKNSPDQKGRGKMDDQFGGSYPRYSGAIDAVTDGPPEDINQMPPAVDQSSKASNIDLSREERSILVQLLHDRLGSLREEIHHSDTRHSPTISRNGRKKWNICSVGSSNSRVFRSDELPKLGNEHASPPGESHSQSWQS